MARPKKADSEQLVKIVDAYFSTEAAGNPVMLKCSLLEKYALREGYQMKAYDFRRDSAVRKRIEELKELAGNEYPGGIIPGRSYKSLDINRILGIRRDPEELAKILSEMDRGWERIYNDAVLARKTSADFKKENKKLMEENNVLSDKLKDLTVKEEKASSEAKRLTVENRYLRKMLKTYLYPAIANEILVEEGQVKNPDTQVSDVAKEKLIDGRFPSDVGETVRQDAMQIQTLEDAVAAMWAGIGGKEK